MCYSDQSQPPIPPGATGKATSETLVLEARDGNKFHATLTLPEKPASKGIVIYPDVRGLFQFYKDLALRFAEIGIAAIALDYFGRTAGLTGREEGFEFMPHVQELRVSTFTLDVQAAMASLREKIGGTVPVFVTGFCMGGSLTLITGTNRDLGFAGLIPFYSGMTRNFGGDGTVLEIGEKVAYPVLGFYGGADQSIPQSSIDELEGKLDTAGVPHHLMVYPGAPHSFFDRTYDEYTAQSADAWKRLLAFIETGKVGE
jgi:carboxymethylenebutenolidase